MPALFLCEKFRKLPKKHKIIPKKQHFVLRTVYMLLSRCAVTKAYIFRKSFNTATQKGKEISQKQNQKN